MGEIAYLPEVEEYLKNLIDILFEKEYFGFRDAAENYVFDLIDFIELNAETAISKPCPENLENLGKFYFTYQASYRTTWYVFFERFHDKTLITYVMNNHISKAAELNLD